MTTDGTPYWKRLWRWVSSQSLAKEDLASVLDKNVVEALRLGLASYKPHKPELYAQLQTKYSDQTKLLSVVQTLQHYLDVDCFQIWEIMKHYLCDISYGTPDNALKNVAFVDTRPTFLLPNAWNFYYSERLFLLKLLQYIIEFKNDKHHKYCNEFTKIIDNIGIERLKTSLIAQFEKLIIATPPPRKIQSDFGNESVRQEWAESNLKEQLVILQILMLIANEYTFTESEFTDLFKLFKKHYFGKNQGYSNFLEEQHREACLRVMYMEVGLFTVILESVKIKNVSAWIENTKEIVEIELTKLEPHAEHSLMLIVWMMLTLQSESHVKLFESQYQQYGATALRMKVFIFIEQMLKSAVYSDDSECALIMRLRVFRLLNELCDRFDGDGTMSQQAGVMTLCAGLLRTPAIAQQFWTLHQRDEQFGSVSLWHTALEYFPYNFSALSILSAGLADAGKDSVRNLIAELKNLPVYAEIYNPNSVPLMAIQSDNAVIGREYYPLGDQTYCIEAGSKATIMERREGTMIHYRTPYSYWTIFNSEVEKALDRKQNYQNVNATLEKVYEGTKVLKGVLKALVGEKEIPKTLVAPSEGVFDVLMRFMRSDVAPLQLLVECLNVCTTVVAIFPKEVHLRLINTGQQVEINAL